MITFIKKSKKYIPAEKCNNFKALDKRFSEMETLRVANMGLVNAGKSSLLNALIKDTKDETFAVGAARKTVAEQTITLSNDILLVDTPGIDVADIDDETAFNSILTADVIIMVHNIRLGDLHEIECRWLERIKSRLRDSISDRLILVLSWIDGRDSDADYPESVDKIKTMLHSAVGADVKVVNVSARRYIKGIKENKTALINKSNIDELRELIVSTARNYRQKKKAVFLTDLAAEITAVESILTSKKSEINAKISTKRNKVTEKYNRLVRQYNDYFSTLKGKIGRVRRLVKEYAEIDGRTVASISSQINSLFGKQF